MTAQATSAVSASSVSDADANVTSKDLRRVIAASVAGSAMEWYDFSIYGTASALIFSDLFFPGLDKAAGLLAIFGAYAAGFFARPFGGLFFGWLGDKYGRKSVLVATVLLMGGSTFCIGLLPTWHQVGVWAAALLVALRLLQGFGAGAEQAGASLIVSEFAPPARRGFYGALPFAGCIIGILLANGIFTLVQRLPKDEFLSYGWRVPFLFSVFVIVAGIVIRMRVKESPVFEEIRKSGHASKQPVRDLMSEARGTLLVAFCLRVGENGSSYLYQVFALSYLTKVLLVDKSVGTIGLTIAAALAVFTIPMMGWLSDRFGRRLMYRLVALFTCLWAFPAFWLFTTKDPVLIVISMAVAIGVGVFGMYGIQGAYFPELFSARYRYTGIAVSKEFAAVASGGIAPFIAAALLAWAQGAYWPIATYIAVLAGISFVATFFAPETRGISLRQ
ncbi:MFS transporter, MHS family, metabolite:H+ symporter [Paraburkholderia steynii]|uniref:MFS transporter, MHS family, metabolite:H+ symporter n=1 Tax=Paraburkholderia steynii TaxID=1245441 RepID=A0A7Z7BCQ8_9BURK|nr:MFS transporter [Paraburkholderia steynii]SDI75868.1 MFS transporter, MHS family, metabolite:H+ symporter [Paraburkholderia steynii]